MRRTVLYFFHVVVTLVVILRLFPAGAVEQQRASTANSSTAKVVRLDPGFDTLVPRDATLEKVADGFAWVEGPVWNRTGSYLLFSDIPNNSVFTWQEQAGVSLFLKPSGYTGSAPFTGREPGSNGLAFDSGGRLVLCEHGDRRIARLESDGHKTTLVDRYEGKRLNSRTIWCSRRRATFTLQTRPSVCPGRLTTCRKNSISVVSTDSHPMAR